MMKIYCKNCAYRLDNSNYCIKKFKVIPIKKPIKCKYFIPKSKFKFNIELKEKDKKIIITPEKNEKMTKIFWWKRLVRWVKRK